MFHKQDDGQRIEIPPGSTITVQYHLHAIVFYHTWIFATNRSLTSIMYFMEQLIEQVPHYTHSWHEKGGSDTCSQLCTQFLGSVIHEHRICESSWFFFIYCTWNDSSFMLPTLTTSLLSKSDLTHLERWFLWYRKGKCKVFGLQRGLWTLGYYMPTDKCKIWDLNFLKPSQT